MAQAQTMVRVKYTERNNPGFYKELQNHIGNYFETHNTRGYANGYMVFKIIFYLTLWLSSYLILLFMDMPLSLRWMSAIFFGVTSLLLILNIGHDAVHNAVSKNKRINNLLGYTFNLVGANAYSWYLKHNVSHHHFPNIKGADIDIETQPLLKISPHTEHKWHYKYQHIYSPFLYMFVSLMLVFILDFAIFNKVKPIRKVSIWKEWTILILTKVFYLAYTIWLPWKILNLPFAYILLGFISMHMVIGLLIALVFQPSHYVDGRKFETINSDHKIANDWAIHQVETTIDISRNSRLANFFLGGLNTNTIHHLFPNICHVHFIKLSEILVNTCKKYNVDYMEYSMGKAIKAHFLFLKNMGEETNE